MGQFILRRGEQAVQGIPIGRLNNLEQRVKVLEGAGGSSPLTTKGDVYVYGATNTRLPVGTDGQILSADSTQSTGLKWIASSGSPGGSDTQLQRNNAGAFGGISGATSDGTNVTYGSGNLRATSPRVTTDISDTNGNELLKVTATASAVNEITVTNAATGNNPSLTATGGDTNIGILLQGKGAEGVLIGNALWESEVALTDAATISVDASLGNYFTVTLGGNRTLGAPTNVPISGFTQKITLRVKQDGTGSRTLAYNAIYRFSNTIPSPTLTTTASAIDYLHFVYNVADTKWDCVGYQLGYS